MTYVYIHNTYIYILYIYIFILYIYLYYIYIFILYIYVCVFIYVLENVHTLWAHQHKCSLELAGSEQTWMILIFEKAVTCSHLQPLAATSSHLPKQPLAATCSHLQPLAATCSHLQPLASGSKWLLLASGCKWLLFWKSNCAPPAPTMRTHVQIACESSPTIHVWCLCVYEGAMIIFKRQVQHMCWM